MFRLIVVVLTSWVFATCYCFSLPDNDIGTVENQEDNTRVIGGRAVSLGDAPYVASLRTLTNIHFCGGVIITSRFILTSGQCTAGRAANGINVVVGSVQLSAAGATYRSSAITTFPGFNANTLENDISLIYTATAIAFTNYVQTISLSRNLTIDGVEAEVFGWGLYSTDGSPNVNYLQTLTYNTISDAECSSQLSPRNAQRLTDSKTCAFLRAGTGTCFGDRGGPLVSYIENPYEPKIPQLIGIVSWQVSCAAGFPDVYERVAHYNLWIQSIVS